MTVSRVHTFTKDGLVTASGINGELDNLVDGVNAVSASYMLGFKNKIINGNFDFWQRGISMAISGTTYQYGPDRWFDISNGSGGVRQWTRQSFTPGQTDVPGEPKYFARLEATSTNESGKVYSGAAARDATIDPISEKPFAAYWNETGTIKTDLYFYWTADAKILW